MLRQALANDTKLTIIDKAYRILGLLSNNGASCLVYLAELLPQSQQQSIKVVIKEFYPKSIEITPYISRGTKGEIIVSESGLGQFYKEKMRFVGGIARQVAGLYIDTGNPTLGCPEAYPDINGTAYSILELGKGTVLSDAGVSELTPKEIIQIMASLCNTISKFHVRGQLYLDVKPNNIFLFEKEKDKRREVALFDFDTVFERDNLPEIGFFSIGWSPFEQENWAASKISEATDIYAIGAVFYWLLTNDKDIDEIPSCILRGDYSFLDNSKHLAEVKETREILKYTLYREPSKRMKNLGKIIRLLEKIENTMEESK